MAGYASSRATAPASFPSSRVFRASQWTVSRQSEFARAIAKAESRTSRAAADTGALTAGTSTTSMRRSRACRAPPPVSRSPNTIDFAFAGTSSVVVCSTHPVVPRTARDMLFSSASMPPMVLSIRSHVEPPPAMLSARIDARRRTRRLRYPDASIIDPVVPNSLALAAVITRRSSVRACPRLPVSLMTYSLDLEPPTTHRTGGRSPPRDAGTGAPAGASAHPTSRTTPRPRHWIDDPRRRPVGRSAVHPSVASSVHV